MTGFIRSLLKKAGIDRAVAYTVLGRVIQAGGGAVSIVFIAKYLTKIEQGYYFTFGSILAVQIFFELGLSAIITQFVAHEAAHLHWSSSVELTGSVETGSRLASLLHFCVKWYAVISVLLFFILLFSGYFFFTTYGKRVTAVSWQIPWVILSFSTCCFLAASPILAFFEGLGKVKEVAQIRLAQQVFQLLILFILFISGLGLLASPLASLSAATIAPLAIFFSSKKKILKNIWRQLGQWKVNYKLEIFPYQWRIALSWISGYFIFQLFNPVIFATEGPVAAGQMGLTLAALTGIFGLSLSWINTKVPLFSGLIAKRDFVTLDHIFNKTLRQSTVIGFLGLTIFTAGVIFLQYLKLPVGTRFLPSLPLILLSLATFSNQFINAIAAYLRSHKKEPLLVSSLVTAILTASSTIVLGKFFGVMGIIWGYTVIMVVIGPIWILKIFKQKKREWHTP